MKAGLKPYPAYKDSGVGWLGEVPEHWDVRQLGRFGTISKGNGGTKEDELTDGVSCVRYGDIYTRHQFVVRKSHSCVSPEAARKYTPILRGDVLFAGSGETIEEIGKSVVNLIESEACCGGDIILFRPSIELDAMFMGYASDCRQAALQKSCMGRGITVMHLYGDQLKYLWIALPSVPEQAAIARFLDNAGRHIRQYIRDKQKLIQLLEEQKQAALNEALMHGLDSSVRTKPSGVEWLGSVPEHWNAMRCRYLFREIDERSADGAEQHLSMSQRLGLVPSHLVENRTLVSENNAGGKLCEVGDLVLNRLKAHLGVFALARFSGVISPDYTVLRPFEPVGALYFEQVLRSPACRRELRIRAKGIVEGFWRLNTDDFYDIRVPVPPVDERVKIIEHSAEMASGIDSAISRARAEVALLEEYRTGLVADVVAGKLDVREAAANLPDQIDESEPLEDEDVLAETGEATSLEPALEEAEA